LKRRRKKINQGEKRDELLKANYYTEPTEIDKQVFEKLIRPEHYLRRVREVINFEIFREKVSDCYSEQMGRGAEDPVLMIKLEFLQFHYNLSDREVIAQAEVNMAFRFFLDLSLESRLPVHSLLSQFRTRLGLEKHQKLFEEVVSQARVLGLVKDRLRLKDATHVIANIAVPTTIQLIAQVRKRLLESASVYADVSEHESRAQQIREVTFDLKDSERLLQRVEHLRQIVCWAKELEKSLPSEKTKERERFLSSLELGQKVLFDRENKGDRTLSAVDTDARRNKHGEYYDGYLLDISVDEESEIITALDVLMSNADEGANAVELMRQEESAQENDIEEMSTDAAGYRGDVFHKMESEEEGLDVILYAPVKEDERKSETFSPSEFVLDQSKSVLSCPGGRETRGFSKQKHGRSFYFSKSVCAGCSLQTQCINADRKIQMRTVFKSDYEEEYNRARARAETERQKQVRALHKKVERKISDIVRNHGGRRARYRGLTRVKTQYFLTGLAVNIKRIVKKLFTVAEEVLPQEV
jgi:transposase